MKTKFFIFGILLGIIMMSSGQYAVAKESNFEKDMLTATSMIS